MANLRYGLKEVADVVFFDIATGKPAIFFDTLKVSTIENESESAEARGGQGNGRLMTWDYGRTSTLTMEDALLSDNSMAMLAGTTIKTKDIKVLAREIHTVEAGKTFTISKTPVNVESIHVYVYKDGLMGDEVTATALLNTVTVTVGADAGDTVIVFYEYNVEGTSGNVKQITFNAKSFPATYRVVGDTVVRGEDGIDRTMQFVIPRAKLQSGFSLTMDAENVSTFNFNLDVMVEAGTGRLYDIIRLDTDVHNEVTP